jgi:hypothetical protein
MLDHCSTIAAFAVHQSSVHDIRNHPPNRHQQFFTLSVATCNPWTAVFWRFLPAAASVPQVFLHHLHSPDQRMHKGKSLP